MTAVTPAEAEAWHAARAADTEAPPPPWVFCSCRSGQALPPSSPITMGLPAPISSNDPQESRKPRPSQAGLSGSCLLASRGRLSRSSAPKQIRERGRWFPNGWTRKDPAEAGPKGKGYIGYWRKRGFRSRTIQGARDRSNRKGPAEAPQECMGRLAEARSLDLPQLGNSGCGCLTRVLPLRQRFEPQAQRRRQSARATMEHGHAGGNLHAAAGSGSAGSQRSGHPLAVRPDHVTGY